jgi:uncharacterized membrane protein YeaQ/YmgE (transglycosylase-associated protein family)
MNLMIWLAVGAFLGWLTCIEVGPEKPQHRIFNVAAGAGGALVAGWLLSLALGMEVRSDELSLASTVEAAFGAVVLLVVVNLFRLIRAP